MGFRVALANPDVRRTLVVYMALKHLSNARPPLTALALLLPTCNVVLLPRLFLLAQPKWRAVFQYSDHGWSSVRQTKILGCARVSSFSTWKRFQVCAARRQVAK